MKKLARLAYLLLQHPWHLHRALVRRGLALKWIDDFRPFWDTVRSPSLPISDYASYTWLEYYFTARAREKHPEGDHFEDMDWQYARLLSYVKRREMHPLRMLKVAWHLRHCKTVLEFGAGAAPYAHFIQTAWPTSQEVHVSDIDGLLFRYAKTWAPHWAMAEGTPLGMWDGIVATEVLEHVPNPIKTATWMIEQGNTVCFDFVEDTAVDALASRIARALTFNVFKEAGTLTGPDKRGLYVWRRR